MNLIKTGLTRLLASCVGLSKHDAPKAGVRFMLRIYMFPPTPVGISFREYLLRSRLGFGLWFLGRRFINALHAVRRGAALTYGHLEKVVGHNYDMVWRITRQRTERLINILSSLRGFDRRSAKVLVIGPRNEAELLLFAAHGFKLENISAIDLFSVSPMIQVMDMHDMSFADNSFDLVYAAYVLTYSDRPQRAVDEMLRVVKDGGLFVAAWGIDHTSESNVVGVQTLRGLLKELYGYIGNRLGFIFWQEEHAEGGKTALSMSSIVRIVKSSDGASYQ